MCGRSRPIIGFYVRIRRPTYCAVLTRRPISLLIDGASQQWRHSIVCWQYNFLCGCDTLAHVFFSTLQSDGRSETKTVQRKITNPNNAHSGRASHV